jgi:hypothetical protein
MWYIGANGYPRLSVYVGREHVGGNGSVEIYEHKAIAAAEHGLAAFESNVHHSNGCRLDNRPENLELRDHAEHTREHANDRWEDYRGSRPWHDAETLRELYVEDELTSREVADELGTTKPTILRWLRKHDLPVRSSPVGK